MWWKKFVENKTLNSILGFANESLLFTNLWIFFYKTVLVFLRSNFIPKIPQLFLYPADFPEPFEIPLYVGLSVIFAALIYLLHKYVFAKFKLLDERITFFRLIFIKLSFFLFLLALFVNGLGKYPLNSSYYTYSPRFDLPVYIIFYIVNAVFFIFLLAGSAIMQKLLKRNKTLFHLLIYIFVYLIISFVTFEAKFPISGVDYSFFYGPVWEITQGKTIFATTSSQYGFLSVLILSVLYKIGLFSFGSLPIITWALFIIQYFLSFCLIYKISRSAPLAFIGLISILVVNHLSWYIIPVPQYPLRWLPLIVGIFLVYKSKKIDSLWVILSLTVMSFVSVDAGLYLIFAYFSSLFLLLVNKILSLKRVIIAGIALILSLVGFYLILNLIHVVLGYKPINLVLVFSRLRTFAQGGFMFLPMVSQTYFWAFILIFISTIILFIRKLLAKENIETIVFITCITFFVSLYFIGNSRPEYLFPISLFIIFNFFLLVGDLFQKIDSSVKKILALFVIFLAFVFWPIYNRGYFIADLLIRKFDGLKTQNLFNPAINSILKTKYNDDLRLINKYIKDPKILIVYNDDTYLLSLLNKKNLLHVNPLISITTKNDLDFATYEVSSVCPKQIVVDCNLVNKCKPHFDEMLNPVQFSLSISQLVFTKIQSTCETTYQPVECNNNLCVVQSQ